MTATAPTALNSEKLKQYCSQSRNDLGGKRNYDYGFRDYSPVAMRFTTVDPIKDNSNWYSYVGNDPINRIDLFGLEDVVVIFMLDRDKNNTKTQEAYNILVNQQAEEIIQAATDQGQTVAVYSAKLYVEPDFSGVTLKDKDGTKQTVKDAYQDNDTERLILVGHGGGSGTLYDEDRNKIDPSTLGTPGNQLTNIDLVSCHGDAGEAAWENASGLNPNDVRSYNPSGDNIWYNQTNDALNNRIPESITSGVNNSGPPSVAPGILSIFGNENETNNCMD